MFEVNLTPNFLKKTKKLVNKSLKLAKLIDSTIQALQANPKNSSLKSHKVITPKFGMAFSSRVSGDLRIIWDYRENQMFVLDLLDIGGHSGSGSVY